MRRPLTFPLALLCLYALSPTAGLARSEFDADFLTLHRGGGDVDLAYFSRDGAAAPGTYGLALYVNGDYQTRERVELIVNPADNANLLPLLDAAHLQQLGIDAERLAQLPAPANPTLADPAQRAATLLNRLPDADVRLDFNRERLEITLPQKYLLKEGDFKTPPPLWDHGVPALLVNYSYSGQRLESGGEGTYYNALALSSSLNYGAWRLRNESLWLGGGNGSPRGFQSNNTYVERIYTALNGGLFTAGQTHLASDFAVNFPFTGVRLASDDDMLKSVYRQYAPLIRGVATGQSRVTLRQAGQIIYQRSVPAGEFEFDDVSNISSGDIEVEIEGADGTVRRYTQASAALPLMQREGRYSYRLSAGKYRGLESATRVEPWFLYADLARGVGNQTTLYGNLLYASHYVSLLLGASRDFAALGALALDITHASAELRRDGAADPRHGQAFRVLYTNAFAATGTTVNLTGYRYSTRDYYDFNEAVDRLNQREHALHLRTNLQVSLQQSLQAWGQLSLSLSRNRYWNRTTPGVTLTSGYIYTFPAAAISLTYNHTRARDSGQRDDLLFANLSVPLDRLFGPYISSVRSDVRALNGRVTSALGLSGGLPGGALSYGLSKDLQRGDQLDVNTSYTGRYAEANAAYARDGRRDNLTYGLRGAVAVHPYGVTASRPLSHTQGNALVVTDGAGGVPISGSSAVQTDYFGRGIVTNLSSYGPNALDIDVARLADDVEADEGTHRRVIPTRGALVVSRFHVNRGQRVLFTLQRRGKALPLGSSVTLTPGAGPVRRSFVGEAGQIYFSGLPARGELTVQATLDGARVSCDARYALPAAAQTIHLVTLECE
ncbi:fimbrial biogenesis outer membrane usher protein [Edwardsiella piscicida]|uniref:fimbria/pilus outer membrane usher protein n=1 Tax=Edwardsiella piscicida TaxID=1263550 RepID=UPI002479347E|nr:fimbria/pilus outer membrane usher protein [Edwardsiella piscicida]ELM3735261.1 fimbrial biogenesis outer membrane usher protein [Edwardsiella piscicida]WGS75878.1 fimbrial biogenesis outer membrane usher protein [Edwardsiella piscicida]WGS79267.1 fimbrial biogenesis outer membrane usher protein [Edwardsiella piscicida]